MILLRAYVAYLQWGALVGLVWGGGSYVIYRNRDRLLDFITEVTRP